MMPWFGVADLGVGLEDRGVGGEGCGVGPDDYVIGASRNHAGRPTERLRRVTAWK